MNINWKVRFTRKNMVFLFRFLAALIIPVLGYMGIRYDDLTTWAMVWDVIVQFFSNPFLIFLTLFNAFNIVPDPVVKGLSDSPTGLRLSEPRDNGGKL